MSRADSKHQLYGELVREFASPLYRFAHRLCGSPDSADDLVQETFCEAWRSLDSLREPERGRAWLYRILRRRFAQSIRRKQRSVPLTTDDVALLSQRELLALAIDELDDRFKEPFLLMFADGLSCKETAETLEVPLGTVLSRIHRARVFLRRRLRELDADGTTQSDATAEECRKG